MCGIAGVMGFNDARSVLDRMRASLLVRGPDGSGVHVGESGCDGVCHTRLAIIDTTNAAAQPMSADGGKVTLTYNGEIYNYRELRGKLAKLGYKFVTDSDTEVLLAGYLMHGTEFFNELRGMFALGLLDERNKTPVMLLLRDPLGIKPLYIYQKGSALLFASQVRTLIQSQKVPLIGNLSAAREQLAFGSVRGFESIICGVLELEPGRIYRFTKGTLTKESGIAWVPHSPIRCDPISIAGAHDVLLQTISEALVADVPIGCLLSGGIDSTLICALATRAGIPVKAFTLLGREAGEVKYSKENAEALRIPLRIISVDESSVVDGFERYIAAMDQPSSDGFNTWLVCRSIAGDVKVLTSGLGGDEVFGGYPHFRIAAVREQMARWGVSAGLRRQVPNINSRVGYLLLGSAMQTTTHLNHLRRSRLGSLLQNDMPDVNDFSANESWAVWDMTRHELSGYLRSTLLRDSDSMSMAHGIELRPPLLHPACIMLAAKLPTQQKVTLRAGKVMLRRVLEKYYPKLKTFPGKRGFELPYQRWAGRISQQLPQAGLDEQVGAACFQSRWPKVKLMLRSEESSERWSFLVLCAWTRVNKIGTWQ